MLTQDSPTDDFILPANNQSQRLGVELMFLLEYARRQRFFSVVVEHRHGALRDDWPTVKGFIYEVNSAACPLNAMFKHLGVCVESGKRGQESGVDVQNPVAKCVDEVCRQQTHVTCQANKLNIVLLQLRDYRAIVFFARTTFTLDNSRVESQFARACQPGRIRMVAYHHGYVRTGHTAFANCSRKRQHVRSAS